MEKAKQVSMGILCVFVFQSYLQLNSVIYGSIDTKFGL